MAGPFSFLSGLFARAGGYEALAQRFPAAGEPAGALRAQTVMLANTVAYKRCVTLAASPQGLYLRPRPPLGSPLAAALIPWAQVTRVERATLYWQSAVRLVIGEPAVGEVTVLAEVYEALRRQATPPAAAG